MSFWDGLLFPEVKDFTGSLTKVEFKEDDQFISSENSFLGLQLITGLINTYFDFPMTDRNFTPYVGIGAGYTLVKTNIRFHSKYKDSSLDSEQDAKFSGESLSLTARLKAGVNYALSDKLFYDLEASYTMLKEVSNNLPYKKHPNQESNGSILRDIRYLTTAFHLSYFL